MPNTSEVEQKLVQDQLDLLITIQSHGLDYDVAQNILTSADEIKEQYVEARRIADEEAKGTEGQVRAEKVCAAIASGLPDMVAGALAAAKAFQNNDVMNGCASVMSMCAAAAPMLGAILSAAPLLSAAGPVGMLAGAVFSIIGQLLAFFGPKQESLIDEIKNLLLNLSADAELEKIETTHDDIQNFSGSLKRGARRLTMREKDPRSPKDAPPRLLPSILQTPLKTSGDVETFIEKLGAFKIEVEAFSPINSVTMNDFWSVKNWLVNPDRQDLDKWPEVLSVWCKSYSDLMTANLTFYGIAGSADLQKRMKEVKAVIADSPLSELERHDVRTLLISIKSLDEARRDQWSKCNNTALTFLKGITPVARKRGLFVVAYSDAYMYVGTGTKIIQEDKFKGIYQHCHKMLVTPPRGGSNNPRASYDAWVMDSYNKESHHLTLDAQKLEFGPASEQIDIGAQAPEAHEYGGLVYNRFLDWCAVPLAGAGNKFSIYGTLNYKEGGAIESWTWDGEAKTFVRNSWRPGTGQRMVQVRIAAKPTFVPNDPDRNDTTEAILERGPIVYGTLEGAREIFVVGQGQGFQGQVPIPMDVYTGVAVDSKYLWVYGQHGFACATHASVISCINGKRPMPLWLGNGQKKNIPNVIDLSSCEDGTLLVSSPDSLAMSVYHVDFKTPDVGEGERLSIEKWETLVGGGGATQVQKLPIFGWPVFESLKSDLTPKLSA